MDSVTSDLSGMAVELQLLQRNSWMGLLFNAEDAFSEIKQQPIQFFSKQVVSIETDILSRDVYALRLRLHQANGSIVEQQFTFLIGFPFAQIMVAIAVLLLLVLAVIVLKPLLFKRDQQ